MSGLAATRRLLALGATAAGVASVAIASSSWVPAVALAPMVGLLVLALAEVWLPLPRKATRRLDPGERVLLGDELRMTVEVPVVAGNLVLLDAAGDGLPVADGGWGPWRGRRTTVRLRAARRGDHFLPALHVGRVGAFGLWRRQDHIPGFVRVRVLPPTARQHRLRVRPRPAGHVGIPSTKRHGPGDEFHALREYQPSDSAEDINWKATARAGRPIVNQYLPEEPPRVLLFLDTRAFAAEAGDAGEDPFERTLAFGAILADALFAERAQVGLVLLAWGGAFVVPGRGAMQARRVRDMILSCTPGTDAPIADLVRGTVVHMPARADALLVTSNAYDPTLADAVRLLRRRHRRVMIVAPGFPEPDTNSRDGAALRAAGALLNAELERILADVSTLARATTWNPDDTVHAVLTRLGLARRAR